MTDTATTISVGTAVVVFFLTVMVLPLVRYIVSAKDRQIDDLRKTLVEFKSTHSIAESKAETTHNELFGKVHKLELKVTKLEGEVELANGVHSRLEKISDRMDSVVQELGSVQVALNLMMKGRGAPRSFTPTSFPAVRPPKDKDRG